MADTTIEWADRVWNPTTGCDRVSPGCDHCYALTLARRLKGMGSAKYQHDGDPDTSGPGFGFTLHPDSLDVPLTWREPKRVFVNSMSDLFHGGMSLEFLAQVFAVMSIAKQHTFQVLTKRAGVMRAVLGNPTVAVGGARVPFKFLVDSERFRRGYPVLPDSRRDDGTYAWPLPNVWLGVSVEDQKWADVRIPLLLDTPAAVRFLSCEPLLGPVDLRGRVVFPRDDAPRLHWVIAGGESGHGARPMDLNWVRSLREQCTHADVAFFYKQQGSGDGGAKSRRDLDGRTWDEFPQAASA